ncbi:ABC transporter ATP-binding protein [Yinghuangia seranimata]|uniref:ABC transporter ATP-binding protein n=1 Tax=Yinghuangia seranimata TaxID=408067 RepID=UPI00248B1D49|nr:ABC transporter ATP-binding protein [Yinghuangia seranimata]MDI2132043.1 ABC transporter ATP-binding protein [Yinghuangia seranimata]
MTATAPKPGGKPTSADAVPLLSVDDLRIRFRTEDGVVKAVDGLSFTVDRGRTLGIVGESGSGKSVTNLALLGLHNPARTTIEGRARFDGVDLLGASQKVLRDLRGRRMSMVFQDPLTALSPYYSIGEQIAETYRRHTGADRKKARLRAVDMLDRVGIPHAVRRVDDYPHQFSGGMRQRAMIAMALVCDPDLLIADEPTTALDVTVQAQILDLLAELQRELGTAIILVTHDLGVIEDTADEVLVMYAGRCVERGTTDEVLTTPQHPYTWGLLSSMPRLTSDVDEPLRPVPGSPPSLLNPPSGCPFHPRCVHAIDTCRSERPALARPEGLPGAGSGVSACHLDADARLRARGLPVVQHSQGAAS